MFVAFNNVAVDTGAKTEQVGTFMAKLRQQQFEAVKGNKVVSESLQALGVDLTSVAKMTTEQFVEAVAKGYTETENFGALVKLTSTENAPKMEQALVSLGKNGFGSLIAEMKDAGRVMDTEFLDKVEDAQTRLQAMGQKTTIFFADIASGWWDFVRVTSRQIRTGESLREIRKSDHQKKKVEEGKRRLRELAILSSTDVAG